MQFHKGTGGQIAKTGENKRTKERGKNSKPQRFAEVYMKSLFPEILGSVNYKKRGTPMIAKEFLFVG